MSNPPDFEDETEEYEDKDESDDDDRSPQEFGLALRLDNERARHQQVGVVGGVHSCKVGIIQIFLQ